MQFRTILPVFVIGTLLISCDRPEETKKVSPRPVAVVPVVERSVSREGSVTGEIQARVQSELSFRLSGKIVERFVDVGTHVKEGQLLARIDSTEQKADLAVAVANLQAAGARQVQARLTYDRQKALVEKQALAQAALDEAKQALLTAVSESESAHAQLESSRDALSQTELRADSDGIITRRDAEVGQVGEAAKTAFVLAHDGPRDAVFGTTETLLLDGDAEKVATITLLSDPTRKAVAEVREISPTIDTSTGTIKVKLRMADDAAMPLGAAVSASFRYAPQTAIELPWSALTSTGSRPAVWTVDRSSLSVTLQQIEVSTYQTGVFTVSNGLAAGDIVVSEGGKFLKPGDIVSFKGPNE